MSNSLSNLLFVFMFAVGLLILGVWTVALYQDGNSLFVVFGGVFVTLVVGLMIVGIKGW